MNSKIDYENVIDVLLQSIPELKPVLDEHLMDQNGHPLQHAFFGDMTRYVVKQVRSPLPMGQGDTSHVVQRILALLDSVLASPDSRVRGLVVASFLENLDQRDASFQFLKSMIGPNLKREISRLG